MKENTKTIGERSVACILAALLKAGKTVLLPFGDNQRYDMVIEEDGNFTRIQCKTGRLRNGVIAFNVCSQAGGSGKRRDYQGEIDVFGVYCPELDTVYIVPIKDTYATTVSLRVTTPKVEQPTINWASDYEL